MRPYWPIHASACDASAQIFVQTPCDPGTNGTRTGVASHARLGCVGSTKYRHTSYQFRLVSEKRKHSHCTAQRSTSTYVSTMSKRRSTFAHVWPFSIVNRLNVRLEATLLCKTTPASGLSTFKWLLPVMNCPNVTR